MRNFSKKNAEKVAELKKHYIFIRNEEDSRTRQSKSNDNRTRQHPVDLLAGHLLYIIMSNQKPRTIEESGGTDPNFFSFRPKW